MKFSEIANRLTGISTPFGGASWQPAEMEIAAARRVITFLEDRRVGQHLARWKPVIMAVILPHRNEVEWAKNQRFEE